MFPSSIFGRAVVATWLTACVCVLAFGYVQQAIHDMPVAFVWFMIFLTFPVGFLVAAVVGITSSAVTGWLGIPYQPFWDLVPYWFASVALGYAQWFIVLPKLLRWALHAKSRV